MNDNEPESNNKIVLITDMNENASDHKYAKQNMIDAIETAKTMMLEMEELARSSQHPGAYRVYNEMFSKFIDANKAIMENNLIKSKLDNSVPKDQIPQQVTNNLFVGTTAQLQDKLEKKLQSMVSKIEDKDKDA